MVESISGPGDLKGRTLEELNALAASIRRTLIANLCRQGGHVASNLGVVELTLALHSVLDSPRDKILWDVSHQSYPHKLLTNRFRHFHTVRQLHGLAGYTNPDESEHDHFHWGHAGVAVSAAVGMARARDLRGESHVVVAVVGDGAITSGITYEALNHAGAEKLRVIVVLNDNGMSISENVGAMCDYLQQLRRELSASGHRAGTVFEELGWRYLGPVDGHDIESVRTALVQAVAHPGPCVIHAVTVKGKGYEPAESGPRVFHGTGAFDPDTGVRASRSAPPTYSEVFAQTLTRLARTDDRVVAVTAAMLDGTALAQMAREFPARVVDVGIAEQHATALCAGMARGGLRPVFAVYSTFLQRAYDQVIHDVALQQLPVLFAVDRAGLVEDGATHQGVYDIAYLRCIPNLTLMAPKDEQELQHMLYTGLQLPGPSAIRYPRANGLGLPLQQSWTKLPIGKGELLREGDDVAIIALGTMVAPAMQAAGILEERGISAAVVNARFVKPLDHSLLEECARRTGLIITVEEGSAQGGFGGAVTEHLTGVGIPCAIIRMGVSDRFVAHGNPQWHRSESGLDADGIAKVCSSALGMGGARPALRRLTI